MGQDSYKDFAELYRAAYAEQDQTRKLELLHEVQRRIDFCDEEASPLKAAKRTSDAVPRRPPGSVGTLTAA